jgi:hypothetical protein
MTVRTRGVALLRKTSTLDILPRCTLTLRLRWPGDGNGGAEFWLTPKRVLTTSSPVAKRLSGCRIGRSFRFVENDRRRCDFWPDRTRLERPLATRKEQSAKKVAAIVDRRLDPTSTSRYGTLGLAQFRHGLHVSSLALKPVPRAEVSPLRRIDSVVSHCMIPRFRLIVRVTRRQTPGAVGYGT